MNECLYHPDEESDPILRKGIPLLKSLELVDVIAVAGFSKKNQEPNQDRCSICPKQARGQQTIFC